MPLTHLGSIYLAFTSLLFYTLAQKFSTHCDFEVLDSVWVPPGFRLDSVWVLSRFCLGSTWVPPGFRLGSTWVPSGFRLDSAWVLSGYHLGSAWVPLTLRLAFGPKLYGPVPGCHTLQEF